MATQPRRHRFSVAEYYEMAETGLLGEDRRVELVEGEIIDMTPIGSRHAACLRRLRLLFEGLDGRAIVQVQDPIRLDGYSEPQPDLTVLRYRNDFYASGHPGPADILLVVEIAGTSAGHDREVKVPLFARAGIPEAWLVDLIGRRLEIYRAPSPAGYRHLREAQPGERYAPAALPDTVVNVSDVLGEA